MKLAYLCLSLLILPSCHHSVHQGMKPSNKDKETFGEKVMENKTISLAAVQDELSQ